ncbi:MAG TPA: penicillin acylase family protein [Solirubrobacterales bacterium]|nr:penicillin acylase family protein [Solirubrobacterales bacterium]
MTKRLPVPRDARSAARWAIAGAAGAAALGASAAAALRHQFLRRPLPRTEGRQRVAGLSAPVEIRRDRWGVPHVSARTIEDLWFAQGYCHGQDRLWQMELYRLSSSGRISEIAGRPGLPSDRLMRTLGMRRFAEREEAGLEAGLRAQLEACCAGVNAAAASARALPAEFQILRLDFDPWRPADMLTAMKLLAFGLSTNWERELLRADMTRELGPELTARLDPGYPIGHPVITEPGHAWDGDGLALAEQIDALRATIGLAAEASGSNNWAVSGERSATGDPLIAGDPHLPPSMPGIFYQVDLGLNGRFARGASLPGIPGINMGQNNDVAFTFTNAMADVQDLFIERIEGDRYEFEGEWLTLELREEEIQVKGSAPERLEVRSTHHGPIVNRCLGADDAEPLALRWLVLDSPAVTDAQVRVLEPNSGPELEQMLAAHNAPVSNLIWADRHGSIGYKTVGRIPVRRGGCPDLPKPGWTGEYEWEGTVPYDELPTARDPECGYLITANNRIANGDSPHVSSDYLDGYRARRIEELIVSTPEHDHDSFEAMQTDNFSIPGIETVHRLARLRPRDQREVAAIERLKSWDGRLRPDSIGASIYQAFTTRFAREVARAAMRDRDLAERWLDRSVSGFTNHITSPWRWHSHLLRLWEEGDEQLIGTSWEELALDALRGGLDDLADRFGPDPSGWRWGRIHRLDFPHAFAGASPLFDHLFNRSLEAGGGQETVSQIAHDPNDPYKAVWAPCWRMVADPTDPQRTRWQQFTGQSGQPGSPHYDDLQEAWLAGRTQPMVGEGPWRELVLEP